MRILVLAKRHYMGKDLISDRFGRYFEIPEELAHLGHDVSGITISYRLSSAQQNTSEVVSWESINALPFPPLSITKFLKTARSIIDESKPDVIWAGSDVIHCIVASALSRHHRIPCVLDLYDNYEAYKLTRAPMLKRLFISACQQADRVTTVGDRLKKYVETTYNIDSEKIAVLSNAVNSGLFKPLSKTDSRESLGLPASAKLIGTAGALTKDRGIDTVYEAFLKLAEIYEDIHLVVAGQRDRTISKYKHPRIIDLGILPLCKVPSVYNSLDVAIISNKKSIFGEYCFPQKFYEIASCQTPLVATGVGEMSNALATNPSMIYSDGSSDDLKRAIIGQLENPRTLVFNGRNSWSDRAITLENTLCMAITTR